MVDRSRPTRRPTQYAAATTPRPSSAITTITGTRRSPIRSPTSPITRRTAPSRSSREMKVSAKTAATPANQACDSYPRQTQRKTSSQVGGPRPPALQCTPGLKTPKRSDSQQHRAQTQQDRPRYTEQKVTPQGSQGLHRLLADIPPEETDQVVEGLASDHGSTTLPPAPIGLLVGRKSEPGKSFDIAK